MAPQWRFCLEPYPRWFIGLCARWRSGVFGGGCQAAPDDLVFDDRKQLAFKGGAGHGGGGGALQCPAQRQQIHGGHLGPGLEAVNDPVRLCWDAAAAHAASLGSEARGGGLKAKTLRWVTSATL